MKRSVLIIALILAGFGMKVLAEGETTSYVKTDTKVYIGDDLKQGIFNMKVISSDGTVTKVPYRDVRAYMDDSRLFEYLPVVCENYDTTCYAMMQYVTSKSGLNLYRYCCYEGRDAKFVFYVYKEGKFHLRVDQKNAATVLPFFGLKVV